MPFVRLALYGANPSDPDLARLHKGLAILMAGPLRKKRELTVVSVEPSAAPASLGGAVLGRGAWTAQLTALVTAGTNTAEEKAAFQRDAHALLVDRFGEPGAPLYIVVQEIPGLDWGYGGLSQSARAPT